MKKYLINLSIVILLIIHIICIPNQVSAVENTIINICEGVKIAEDMPGAVGGAGGGDVFSGDINTDSYKPTISNNSKANSIIGKMFGALQIVGIITIIISIALLGFNYILGSASEKAQEKGKSIGILVGAIMIFGVSTIAKFIISAIE